MIPDMKYAGIFNAMEANWLGAVGLTGAEKIGHS